MSSGGSSLARVKVTRCEEKDKERARNTLLGKSTNADNFQEGGGVVILGIEGKVGEMLLFDAVLFA